MSTIDLTNFKIDGLEDYLLIGNNPTIKLYDFDSNILQVKLNAIIQSSNESISVIMYPINNEIEFNINEITRALFPDPEHLSYPLNTLQLFNFEFVVTKEDENTYAVDVEDKPFIRGYRTDKTKEWKLSNNEVLLVNKFWYQFNGISIPYPYFNTAYKINGTQIDTYSAPTTEIKKITPISCNGKLIRFLNSKGGYQYWYFDYFRITESSKSLGYMQNKQYSNLENHVKTFGSELTKTIELKTRVYKEDYEVLKDLANSYDIYTPTSRISNVWHYEKLHNNGNSVSFDNKKNYEDVVLKFEFNHDNINNSLL